MPPRRCPVCARQFESEEPSAAMPFCSERCRRIDLHRWLGEKYALPSESSAEEEEPPRADQSQDDPTDGHSGRN